MTTISKTIKLDEAAVQRLSRLAERRDRAVHYLLCEAVQQFLEREEQNDRLVREALASWQSAEPATTAKDERGTAARTITIIAVQQEA